MARAPGVTHLLPSNGHNRKAPVALNERQKNGGGELFRDHLG